MILRYTHNTIPNVNCFVEFVCYHYYSIRWILSSSNSFQIILIKSQKHSL